MMQLTDEQFQAAQSGQAVELQVGENAFVLVSREVFDRVWQVVLEDGPSPLATARMIQQTAAEDDADDPTLESYQQYKRKQ